MYHNSIFPNKKPQDVNQIWQLFILQVWKYEDLSPFQYVCFDFNDASML